MPQRALDISFYLSSSYAINLKHSHSHDRYINAPGTKS